MFILGILGFPEQDFDISAHYKQKVSTLFHPDKLGNGSLNNIGMQVTQKLNNLKDIINNSNCNSDNDELVKITRKKALLKISTPKSNYDDQESSLKNKMIEISFF